MGFDPGFAVMIQLMKGDRLSTLRLHYAEEIRLAGGILSEQVVNAFASVPRERFLGPGPWQIPLRGRHLGDSWSYRTTFDSDPKHLYHNTLVAIDSDRVLNNGLPSFLAFKLDAACISKTDRVVHIGCGVGYYTAIIAELASEGRILAIEADKVLTRRSERNLAEWDNVEVILGNGITYDPGETDVFFINAGVTCIPDLWLDRLAISGRLILPLTHNKNNDTGNGIVLLVKREQDSQLSARTLCEVSIFDCLGGRSSEANAALGKALSRQDSDQIRSLKPMDHSLKEDCWIHLENICISKKSIT